MELTQPLILAYTAAGLAYLGIGIQYAQLKRLRDMRNSAVAHVPMHGDSFSVLEAAPYPVAVVNSSDTFTYANRAFHALSFVQVGHTKTGQLPAELQEVFRSKTPTQRITVQHGSGEHTFLVASWPMHSHLTVNGRVFTFLSQNSGLHRQRSHARFEADILNFATASGKAITNLTLATHRLRESGLRERLVAIHEQATALTDLATYLSTHHPQLRNNEHPHPVDLGPALAGAMREARLILKALPATITSNSPRTVKVVATAEDISIALSALLTGAAHLATPHSTTAVHIALQGRRYVITVSQHRTFLKEEEVGEVTRLSPTQASRIPLTARAQLSIAEQAFHKLGGSFTVISTQEHGTTYSASIAAILPKRQ